MIWVGTSIHVWESLCIERPGLVGGPCKVGRAPGSARLYVFTDTSSTSGKRVCWSRNYPDPQTQRRGKVQIPPVGAHNEHLPTPCQETRRSILYIRPCSVQGWVSVAMSWERQRHGETLDRPLFGHWEIYVHPSRTVRYSTCTLYTP